MQLVIHLDHSQLMGSANDRNPFAERVIWDLDSFQKFELLAGGCFLAT
jgi:hypothetical protein